MILQSKLIELTYQTNNGQMGWVMNIMASCSPTPKRGQHWNNTTIIIIIIIVVLIKVMSRLCVLCIIRMCAERTVPCETKTQEGMFLPPNVHLRVCVCACVRECVCACHVLA